MEKTLQALLSSMEIQERGLDKQLKNENLSEILSSEQSERIAYLKMTECVL